ncbi:hypothetical protein Hanom_Chr03g00243741 [Helianthus anomalus]
MMYASFAYNTDKPQNPCNQDQQQTLKKCTTRTTCKLLKNPKYKQSTTPKILLNRK